MSNAVRKLVPLVIQGGATYSANAQAMIDLSAIQPIGYQSGGVTYLQEILLTIDAVIANASGGDVVLGPAHVFDLIEQLQVVVPGMKPLIDLPTRAGSLWYRLMYAMQGKPFLQCNNGATLTVTNGGTLTIRLNLPITFDLVGGIKPGDGWIPLPNLKEGSQLLCTWGNGASAGVFATSVTVSSATLSATAKLIEIPELRVPTWRHVGYALQPGSDNQIMGLAGKVLHWLIEVPAQASAQVADSVLTLTQRTQVEVEVDGRKLMERMGTAALVVDYMDSIPYDQAFVFEAAANTMPFVPSLVPTNVRGEGGYKSTQLPIPRLNPIYRVQGTATTPTLVYVYSDLNTSGQILDTIREGQWPLPSAFDPKNLAGTMRPKTASGFAAPAGSSGAARVPVKMYPEGASSAATTAGGASSA